MPKLIAAGLILPLRKDRLSLVTASEVCSENQLQICGGCGMYSSYCCRSFVSSAPLKYIHPRRH